MIIDGKKEAAILREEIKNEIANLKKILILGQWPLILLRTLKALS